MSRLLVIPAVLLMVTRADAKNIKCEATQELVCVDDGRGCFRVHDTDLVEIDDAAFGIPFLYIRTGIGTGGGFLLDPVDLSTNRWIITRWTLGNKPSTATFTLNIDRLGKEPSSFVTTTNSDQPDMIGTCDVRAPAMGP